MKQLRSSLLALPTCMGKQCPQICSSCFFSLLTFSWFLQYFTQVENTQWVVPPANNPYRQYIDYLKDVVIDNVKRDLSEALTSPDLSSSVGDDRCCKCSTCTCECHKKNSPPPLRKSGPLHLHHLHAHLGTTTCCRNTLAALCFLGSSRTTRLIRNVAIKFLNSLRHVISR
jgi:hypothetical protein